MTDAMVSYRDCVQEESRIIGDGWFEVHGTVPVRREAGGNYHDPPAVAINECGSAMEVGIASSTESRRLAVAGWWTASVVKDAIKAAVSALLVGTSQGTAANGNTIKQLPKGADDLILDGTKRELLLPWVATQFFENVLRASCKNVFGDFQLIFEENYHNNDGHQARLIAEEFMQNVVDTYSVSSLLAAGALLTTPTEDRKLATYQPPAMLVTDRGTFDKLPSDGQCEQGAREGIISTNCRCDSIGSCHPKDGGDITADVSFSYTGGMTTTKTSDGVAHLVPRPPRSESAGLVADDTNTSQTHIERYYVPPSQRCEGSTIGLLSYAPDDVEDRDGCVSIATNITGIEPLPVARRRAADVGEHTTKRGVSVSRKRQRLGTYLRITNVPVTSTGAGVSSVQRSQSAAVRMETRHEASCRSLRQQLTGGRWTVHGGRPRTGIQAGIIGRDTAASALDTGGKRPVRNSIVNAEECTQHQHQQERHEGNMEKSVTTVAAVEPREISTADQGHDTAADDGDSEAISVVVEHAPRPPPRLHEAVSPRRLGEDKADESLEVGFCGDDGSMGAELPQAGRVVGRLVGRNSAGSANQNEKRVSMIHGVAIGRESDHAPPQASRAQEKRLVSFQARIPVSGKRNGGGGGGEDAFVGHGDERCSTGRSVGGRRGDAAASRMGAVGGEGEGEYGCPRNDRWVPPKRPKEAQGRSGSGASQREVLYRVLAAGRRQPFDTQARFATEIFNGAMSHGCCPSERC